MNNTERLIGKMNDELAAFVAGLERLPVQDVIEKAGEIAVKTDMALLVEEAFLGPKETKALLGMRMPLEYLYQEYLKKDTGLSVPFPVSWTVKMKKKQKETQDILSYHTQAAGCSDKARAKASGGRQPIEECGRTGL